MSYPPEPPPPGYGQGGHPGQPPNPPYGGPSYGQAPGSAYGPQGPPRTNVKATVSLVVGIASLVLSWCCGLGVVGVVAVVLGIKARSEIKGAQGYQDGDGLALGGIITGALAVLLGILVLVLIGLALLTGGSFESTTTYGTEL